MRGEGRETPFSPTCRRLCAWLRPYARGDEHFPGSPGKKQAAIPVFSNSGMSLERSGKGEAKRVDLL